MMASMRFSQARLYIGVILAGQFVANVDTAIINVATPSIGETLHASGAELQLTVSVYILATAMLLVTAARLGALYGYRRTFLMGLTTFTLASLACGLAPNVLSLIVARIVQGAGAALMVAQVISGIQRTLTGDARTRAIGAYTMTLSLSAVVGQILGGILITVNAFGLAWRPLFLINVPVGVLLLALALRVMPRDEATSGPRPKLDLIGVALLAFTMFLFVLPLTVGRELAWPAWTIASLIACVPAATIFVWWQRKIGAENRGPLLNFALFSEPAVVPGILAQAFARAPYFATLFTLALYVQVGLGESALVSGCTLISWVAAYGIAGPVYPRLPKHIAAVCGPIGGAIITAAFIGAAIATALHTGAGPWLITCLGFGGFGFGMLSTAMTSQLTHAVPKERAPDLSGVLATMTPISAVFAISTFGSAYLAIASPGGADAATRAFTTVNIAFAVSAAVATLLAVLAMRRAARSRSEGVRALRDQPA
jgi:MFS family permease